MLSILLFAFWIIVSQTVHPHHLLAGLMTAAAVAYFNRQHLAALKTGRLTGLNLLLLVKMILLLLKDVAVANLQVARLVLSRNMPVEPQVVEFNSRLHSPLSRTLLANAITLTPGTLTVNIDGSRFTVHCLTARNAESLPGWKMVEYFRQLESQKEGEMDG